MVLGAYYLTSLNYYSSEIANHYFYNSNDVILAYQQGKIGLHTLFDKQVVPQRLSYKNLRKMVVVLIMLILLLVVFY